MPKLRIEGLQRDLEVPSGQDVRRACLDNHVNVFWSGWARLFNCRGIGLCGACPVRVMDSSGALPPPTKKEVKRLAKRPEDWRLACQMEVRSDVRVDLFPMLAPEERLGQEPVRRARMEDDEREELFRKEREERLEARRAEVREFLETRKKRRSKLVGFVTKRLKKGEGEDEASKKARKKKEKKPGQGFAGRLKRGSKKKKDDSDGPGEGKPQAAPSDQKDAKKQASKKKPGKGKGFKLGKKKEEAQAGSGSGKGEE